MERYELNQLTTELEFTPTSFLEIGSRDGHDTRFVANYWKLDPSKCYIIEAHPELYKHIIRDYPQFKTFNLAASDKNGNLEFNAVPLTGHNVGLSSVLNCTAYQSQYYKVNVTAIRMLDWMRLFESHLDLVKIDVEGYTWEVLTGFGPLIENVKAFQIETEKSEMWKGQKIHTEIVEFMESKGFTLKSKYDAWGNQYDCLFVK